MNQFIKLFTKVILLLGLMGSLTHCVREKASLGDCQIVRPTSVVENLIDISAIVDGASGEPIADFVEVEIFVENSEGIEMTMSSFVGARGLASPLYRLTIGDLRESQLIDDENWAYPLALVLRVEAPGYKPYRQKVQIESQFEDFQDVCGDTVVVEHARTQRYSIEMESD